MKTCFENKTEDYLSCVHFLKIVLHVKICIGNTIENLNYKCFFRNVTRQSQTMVNACKHLVIGGGILGSSLAYKLAESMVLSEGQSSVFLLEKDTVASGTTSKSAGIIIKSHKTNIGTRLASKTLQDIHHFCHSQHFDSFSKVGTHNPVTNTTTPDDGYVDP